MDVCLTIDETIVLTGLVRALVRMCYEQELADVPYPLIRPELVRVASWFAARYGLRGSLFDLSTLRVVPAEEGIMQFLGRLRPALEAEHDWEEVSSLLTDILMRGNGSMRQREIYQRSGRLEEVVDFAVAETRKGTQLEAYAL